MADRMLDIGEFAEMAHYSNRLIRQYCIEGKIKGAQKLTTHSRKWIIPESALKQLSQTMVLLPEDKAHDKKIFENSTNILNDDRFQSIFKFLSDYSCLKSQLIALLQFPEYFKPENNKYCDWRLNYLNLQLCQNIKNLSFIVETDSVEKSLVERHSSEFKNWHVENEYSRLIDKLLRNCPTVDTNKILDNGEMEELYLIIDGKNHLVIMVPEKSNLFDSKHYAEWQRDFNHLTSQTQTAYNEYRGAVRETLLI